MDLTVVLRLLKFVGGLIKNYTMLRDFTKEQVVYIHRVSNRGFLGVKEAPRPDARRAWRGSSSQKNHI